MTISKGGHYYYTSLMSKIAGMNAVDLRVCALVCAILIYGGFGSPTPDNPGWVEFVIGFFLVLSVGFGGFRHAFVLSFDKGLWLSIGQCFLIFGVVFPIVAAVIFGNDFRLAVRDFIPFLFMMLPVFFFSNFRYLGRFHVQCLFISVLCTGFLFSARAVMDVAVLGEGDALYYLGNAPTVLFAAIFCAGSAVRLFIERFSVASIVRVLCLFGLCALCLWPIIEAQQRASLGLFVFSLTVLLLVYFYRSPRRGFLIIAAFTCVLFIVYQHVFDVFADFMHKTQLVGANMRQQEFAAVWAEVSEHIFSLIFGKGWGATFSSPAVADIEVNFTHGLLSSLILKTGLLGLVFGGGYICALLMVAFRGLRIDVVAAISLVCPVLINVFLYASFKSLDFGLVLLLFPLFFYRNVFFGEDMQS